MYAQRPPSPKANPATGYRYRRIIGNSNMSRQDIANRSWAHVVEPGENDMREKMELTRKQEQFVGVDHTAYRHIADLQKSVDKAWYLTLAQVALFVIIMWAVAAHHCLVTKPLRAAQATADLAPKPSAEILASTSNKSDLDSLMPMAGMNECTFKPFTAIDSEDRIPYILFPAMQGV